MISTPIFINKISIIIIMKEFSNKVAVITGAASGIGRSLAEIFLKEGMKIVLADIELDALSQAENELKEISPNVLTVLTDVSKIGDIKALAQKTIDHFGAVHILCNNAGVGFATKSSTTVWENSLSEWKWIFGVNLWGVIHGIHVFIPIMLKQNCQCYVINTASMAGLLTPTIGTGIYSITKHAIIALSEALKLELTRIGAKIKVLALCPGFASTNLTKSDRNRPKELYHGTTTNPEIAQIMKAYQQSIENGISPKDVAEILFHALKGEKFYIPTDHHRYLRRGVKNRMESILQDLQK